MHSIWLKLNLAAVAAIAIVALAVWRLSPSPYRYVRPTIGTWSGGTMWGTTIQRRPALDAKVIRVALRNPEAKQILGRDFQVTGD